MIQKLRPTSHHSLIRLLAAQSEALKKLAEMRTAPSTNIRPISHYLKLALLTMIARKLRFSTQKYHWDVPLNMRHPKNWRP